MESKQVPIQLKSNKNKSSAIIANTDNFNEKMK